MAKLIVYLLSQLPLIVFATKYNRLYDIDEYLDRFSVTYSDLVDIADRSPNHIDFYVKQNIIPSTKYARIGYIGTSAEQAKIYALFNPPVSRGDLGARSYVTTHLDTAAMEAMQQSVSKTIYDGDYDSICHVFAPLDIVSTQKIESISNKEVQIANQQHETPFQNSTIYIVPVSPFKNLLALPAETAEHLVTMCEPLLRYSSKAHFTRHWSSVRMVNTLTPLIPSTAALEFKRKSTVLRLPLVNLATVSRLQNLPMRHEDGRKERCSFCNLRDKLFSSQLISIIPEKNVNARAHFLIVPKKHIGSSVDELESRHVQILREMMQACLEFTRPLQHSYRDHKPVMGFHIPPENETGHLAMHCIVLPIDQDEAYKYDPETYPFVPVDQLIDRLEQ